MSLAMKTPSSKSAFTLIEVLVVIFVVAILAAMLLPAISRWKSRSKVSLCVRNLQQIATGCNVYASDDINGLYPGDVLSGSTNEPSRNSHAYFYFQKLSPYGVSLQSLVCPADKIKFVATNYSELSNSNVSYFFRVNIPTNFPSADVSTNKSEIVGYTFLAGDRNLQANGQPVKPGLFVLTTNLSLNWTHEMHLDCGNLAYGDGHVDTRRTNDMNGTFQPQSGRTDWLVFP